MTSDMELSGEASPLGFVRFAFAVIAFATLTLYGSVSYAEDEPADEKAPNPRNDAAVPNDKNAIAAELSNPTAAVMSMKSLLDITDFKGTAPGAKRASFRYTFQPAFPFMTKKNKGNLIFRPAIPVVFGEPYVNSAGNVDTAVAFGNIGLDSIFGKTFSNGLMVLGGVNTVFPTSSKPELRADWAFGPEAMIGYASKKFVGGVIASYIWEFPAAPKKQIVAGQYFWWINLEEGWQVGSSPVWSYSRETKVTTFPLGIGARKVVILGKKKQPVQLGAEAWLYAAQADALGPIWTIRITIAPVIPIPWGKM